MRALTIATRGSKLALWQAEYIRSSLLRACPEIPGIELLVIKTKGDLILDVPLAKIGGKGLFIKEIEEALLDGRADLAVHSMKDVPMELPQGLALAAVTQRELPGDVLLSAHFPSLEALPQGARLGTSSLRRQAQALALRPDLDIRSLRGNVDTRLAKLMAGEFDAIIMAEAGLSRLGLSAPCHQILPIDSFLPAGGQGALGIELRDDRPDIAALAAILEHAPSRIAVEAERGFLAGLNGGCQVPIAAYAVMPDDHAVRLRGVVMDVRGEYALRGEKQGPAACAGKIGLELAAELLERGAGHLLAGLDTAAPLPR